MGNLAIQVTEMGKKYRRGVEIYGSLIERIRGGTKREEFWAIQEITFKVEKGEVIGIVGKNGSGKSTLLRILSRITRPSSGWAEIYGRVGSLLEVGTGFHPELTGRENMYLNGAILGMNKHEIDKKFEEIVEFAEISDFIDTPVKRYSSGMYVRLAFAVAAHLEPEILLVDEVLAVGDSAFQRKCLGKMEDVAHAGRTVLFVSHNMIAIQSLCSRVIWINNSKLVEEGPTASVVSHYLHASASSTTNRTWEDPKDAPGNETVRIHRVSIRPENGSAEDPIHLDSPAVIDVEFWNSVPDSRLTITLHVFTEENICAFTTGSVQSGQEWYSKPLETGLYRTICRIPANFLNSGNYRINMLVVKNLEAITFQMNDALSFSILEMETRGLGWFGREPGVLRPSLEWTTEFINA